MKNIIIIITSVLILSACKKEEHVSIQGKVINIVTKQAISDVRVKVCDGLRWVGGDTEDGNCQLTYTDKDGNFATDIESEKAHLYFYKEGYIYNNYQGGSVTGTTWLYAGKHTNKVYEIEPECGFYPIYMSTEKPIKEHTLVVNIWQRYRSKEVYNEQNQRYIGREPFVSYDFGSLNFIGDMHVVYRLRFERNGQKQEIIDSVFLKQGEIFRDTIYY